MRSYGFFLALAVALYAVACSQGNGGDSGKPGAGGAGAAPTAIAILGSQSRWWMGEGGASTAVIGDPNMLYLEIGTPPSCSTTLPFAFQCGSGLNLAIGVPPALQKPGTIEMSDPSLTLMYSDVAPSTAACSRSSASPAQGTVEIVSIDASQVKFTLSGAVTPVNGPASIDGTYTAVRCE